MNPNNQPPNQQPPMPPAMGPEREFKEESLNKKFSFAFTRKQCILIRNILAAQQLSLGDFRAKVLMETIELIENAAIKSIGEDDYKPLPKQPAPTAGTPKDTKVAVN